VSLTSIVFPEAIVAGLAAVALFFGPVRTLLETPLNASTPVRVAEPSLQRRSA
jgi:hypothetical protein